MNPSETFSFLLCNMQEDWQLSREAEEKRFLLATVNLFLATALQITLVVMGFHRQTLPVPFWLILIGVYGVVANVKLYERSQFHILRARKLRARLDSLVPEAELESLFQNAEQEQQRAYPLLAKMRLNNIWITLHAVITLLGIIYSMVCLFS